MKKSMMTLSLCGIGLSFSMIASSLTVDASSIKGEQPVAGIIVSLDKYYENTQNLSATDANTTTTLEKFNTKEEQAAADKAKEKEAKKYKNIGIANVDKYLNIRKKASETSEVVGKLPTNAGCTITSKKNGWAKIKSGKVTGYVSLDYLVTGDKVPALAKKVGYKVATVTEVTVRLREKKSTDSTTLTLIPQDEKLRVISSKDDEWVKVSVDDLKGYVKKDFVTIKTELKKAVSDSDVKEDASTGVTSVRAGMVSYAKQFLGNSYVWGGTSLTGGTDCSGFTMRIYQKFGYSISRTSRAQAHNGTSISLSQIKPGDLLFYASKGTINHVAMYVGNGQIIHASNPSDGIKISNAYYRTPAKAVRIIN
ncbi:NPL/P60-family secreted protein [Lachnospiraceae bacterium KM106-2]|nr:NPL/P60-family secreted protein [Lachnospiraceae bacterium KM106-2]